MSETIDGQYANNEDADFFETSDPSYYEESGEGEQVYLDSVLPHAYDPTLARRFIPSRPPKVSTQKLITNTNIPTIIQMFISNHKTED
jgi:hypothetical protein